MSKVKGFQALELIIVIVLFLWAIYFSKDTLEKFSSKRTGFSTYKESRTDFPTTVLCFVPIAKKSFLSQYNITIKDFANSWYPDSLYEFEFAEFKNAAFFILGKDYNISLRDNQYNEHILKEGNNTINEIEVNSFIEYHQICKRLVNLPICYISISLFVFGLICRENI